MGECFLSNRGGNGGAGKGIESIEQTVTSTTDGGYNKITVTLTNGEQEEFMIKNGETGSTGPKGDTGSQGPKGDTGPAGPQGDPVSVLEAWPVGSIYFTMNETSPAQLFGGQWTRYVDKFVYAVGSYTAGQTGGSQTVKLVPNHIPAHSHGMRLGWSDNLETVNSVVTAVEKQGLTAGTAESHIVVDAGYTTDPVGSGTAHTNMPPFVAAYVWERVA